MTCKKSASASKLSLQTLMSRSRQCLAHGADTSCWLSYFARGIPTNVPFMYCVRLASWVLVTRLSADQTAWHQHVSWSPQLSTSLTIIKLDFTHLGLIGKTISLKIHHLETQDTSVRSVSCGCWSLIVVFSVQYGVVGNTLNNMNLQFLLLAVSLIV